VAGVDIGGTHQTVAVVGGDGRIVAQRRTRTAPGAAAPQLVQWIGAALDSAIAEAGPPVQGIGIGFGGPVDHARGQIVRSHHVPAWEGFPLRDVLSERYRAPTVLDNDANAAALGEARFGAGKGFPNLVYVNVGTGIGAGLVLAGRLYRGAHGLAGELGDVTVVPDGAACACGKRGCLEAYASGRALGRRAREAVAADPAGGALLLRLAGSAAAVEGPHVVGAARAGDALATRLLDETADHLGAALATAVGLLDPDAIVLGGGVATAGEVLFGPLRRALARQLLPGAPAPPVLGAALGYDAGVVGAAALALEPEPWAGP
jgi:glucokinase